MSEINKAEFLAKCKSYLMQVTSISHFPKEMEVIDKILFKMWQAGLLDKDSIIDKIEPAPNENTPRGTKVYVRNCDDELWEEAYFCAKFLRAGTYPFAVYCDDNYDLCEGEFASGVRLFKLCIIAEE